MAVLLNKLYLLTLVAGVVSITVPCSNKLCKGKVNGDYEYNDEDTPENNKPSQYVSCVHGFAYCRFCWPQSLVYVERCNQCLYSKNSACWPNPDIDTGSDSGWTTWTEYTSCSVTCGEGERTKTRTCKTASGCSGPAKKEKKCYKKSCSSDTWSKWGGYSNCSATCGKGNQTRKRYCVKLGSCSGPSIETKECEDEPCIDSKPITDLQEAVIDILNAFYKEEYPNNKKTAKLHQAHFQIQKAAVQEQNLGEPDANGQDLNQRADAAMDAVVKSTNGSSTSFTRDALGRFLFMDVTRSQRANASQLDIINTGVESMKDIKKRVGDGLDKTFSTGEATLMFAIDTTGSMIQEIEAAKTIASGIVDAVEGHPIDCILSPFNDPTTGPVTKASSENLTQCITAIGKLEAKLGGNCPELAYTGMLNAMKSNPKFGSPMFVFTDAAARDGTPENVAELKRLAEANGATINFVITESSCLKGAENYTEIASATNGDIFPLRESELPNLLEYVKSSLFIDTSIITGKSLRVEQAFDVESEFVYLMVTVTVTTKDTAKFVELVDANGNPVLPNTTLSTVQIFRVVRPIVGNWKIKFPRKIGEVKLDVKGISDRPIEFTFNFVVVIQGQSYSVWNPLADRTNELIVQIAGAEVVDASSLTVDLVDELGEVLFRDLKLTALPSLKTFKTQLKPKKIPFKVLLKGRKKDGTRFQRTSRRLISSQTSFFQVSQAGNESTFRVGEKGAPVKLQLFNPSETEETYTIKMKTQYGTIIPHISTVTFKGITHADFSYDAPNIPALASQVETITVVANPTNSPAIFLSFEVLMVV